MSNRGRQNVASFLAKDLRIDWRAGAEVFEELLLDYDPSSNYGCVLSTRLRHAEVLAAGFFRDASPTVW